MGLISELSKAGEAIPDMRQERDNRSVIIPAPELKSLPQSTPAPASGAGIIIVPSVTRPEKQLGFEFCYYDNAKYDPQIIHIRVAGVGASRDVCEIVATKRAWLWKNWLVGTVPKGFRSIECRALSPGEYEVYVDAVVGTGTIRIAIDQAADVRTMPWDNLAGLPPDRCPHTDGKQPRVIPRINDGEEGILERRMKDLQREREARGRSLKN